MASIGIAFGLGFFFGPAIGALFSAVDISSLMPSLQNYGVNPFSVPALVAFVLAVYNLKMVITNFKETLPQDKRGKSTGTRSINPFKLFKVEDIPGVSLNNRIYFLYILAFSGMEFTLTFLAAERFFYSPAQNGYIFLYVGFILILVCDC